MFMDFSRRTFLTFAGAATASAGISTVVHARTSSTALNARDFGVGIGGGDQSKALQKAINKAAARKLPLFLPGGEYAVGNINLPSGLQWSGVPGRTVLNYNGSGAMFQANDATHVSLSGLSFNGHKVALSSASDALIVAQNTAHFRLDNCQVSGSAANGIRLYKVSGSVRDCTLSQMAQAGIFSNDATGMLLTQNHIHDSDNNGILVWRSVKSEDGTIVSQNRIENIKTLDGGNGQNGNGINIFRAHNVIASQNRISDCAYSAIRSNAGSACQIIGNNCSRIGEVALYAEFGFEGALIAQNIIEKAGTGISITNFNNGGRLGICANNIIRDMIKRPEREDFRGVGIGVEADTIVSGNLVENAPVMGIGLGWGKYLRNVSTTGNIIRNSPIGIGVSVSQGAGHALISDNLISGATTHAIAGFDFHKILPDDLINSDIASRYAHLTVKNNVAA